MQRRDIIQTTVEAFALKDLLHDLAVVETQISIRVHVKGQPPASSFASVLVFAKHAIILAHMPSRTVINITDLHEVVAFEIDRPYKAFLPHRLYSVNNSQLVKHSEHGT